MAQTPKSKRPKIGQRVKCIYRYSAWYGIVKDIDYDVLVVVICLDRNKKPMRKKTVQRLHYRHLIATDLIFDCPNNDWLK